MSDFILGLIFSLLAFMLIDLKKVYHNIPKKELQKRSLKGDRLSETIYKIVAYGPTLNLFLGFFIILFSSIALVLYSRIASIWILLVISLVYLFIAFVYLPTSKIKNFSNKLVLISSPIILVCLNLLEDFLESSKLKTKLHIKSYTNAKIYDKSDLRDLLVNLSKEHENRIQDDELTIINNSISLTEQKVADLMLKYSFVHTVKEEDSISPIVMDELYKSKQQYIPVINDESEIVGIIDLSRLNLTSKGSIKDYMETEIYYLNEKDDLSYALNAFKTTNCPYFIVIDHSKNYTGLLTFNDLVNKLIGHIPGNPIDEFTSKELVSKRYSNIS